MKILIITPYFFPHPGGSQNYIVELYSKLMEQNPDVSVDVLTYDTEKVGKQGRHRGIRIHRVSCVEILRGQFAIPNYFELVRVLRKLKRKNFEVVNSHTRFFDNSWWTPVAAKYLGAKSILTDHCAYHPVHGSWLVRKIAQIVERLMVPFVSGRYDEITVVSKATGRFLKQLGMKKKAVVVYGGVDSKFFISKKSTKILPNLRTRIGDGEVVVSFVGRMIEAKGAQVLMDVAEKLVKQNRKVRFVFAGDGPLLGELRKNTQDRVDVLGKLNREQVGNLLVNTDILVHPSRHHEGFPIVLLEAGAGGCAVVTTNRGGVKELVENGKTGIITDGTSDDLEKKLKKLIADSKLRKMLGRNLRQKVSIKFDWELIAKDYDRLLQRIIRKER